MKNNVAYLFVITTRGNIVIPFKSLKDADKYTVRMDGDNDLIDRINRTFKLDIGLDEVYDVYLEYHYKAPNNDREKRLVLPLKYQKDNYDVNSLIECFSRYLKEDHSRILEFDVKYMGGKTIPGYLSGEKKLNDWGIDKVIDNYFKNESYRKKRDVYFKLKYKNKKIKINKVDKIEYDRRRDLTDYEYDENDTYLNSLMRRASLGEEESNEVMETLSLYDLEDLTRKIRNPYFGVVDGALSDKVVPREEVLILEETTGINIQRLSSLVQDSIKGKNSRRR